MQEILIGDSLKRPIDRELLEVLEWWTSYHSSYKFTHDELETTVQEDYYSCGLLSFDALAQYLVPTEFPAIGSDVVDFGRSQMMQRVLEHHIKKVR